MDLKVMIVATVLKEKKNFFVMVQLDELQFPSKENKTTKYRTELQAGTSTPVFVKNRFIFNELNLGSRITFKVGCFSTPLITDPKDNQKLMDNATLEGSAVLTFTQRILTLLRETDRLEQDLKICDRDQEEIGRITLTLQFKPHTFEQMLDEDIRKVERLYFDPFEDDEEEINKKTKIIEETLVKKQAQLDEIISKLDYIKTSHKSISVEAAHLKRQKDILDKENLQIRQKLDKLESIKELDIQIDLLKQSDHGIDILREKYAKLLNRMNLERLVYEELSDQYFQLEKRLAQKKEIEAKTEEVKKASEEQEFHIKRSQDMLPGVAMLAETIKSQEQTIQNLQSIIKESLRKNNVLANREIDVELKKMRYEHEYLKEKNKQLKTLTEMNEGVVPYKYFLDIQKDPILGENPYELEKYKKRATQMLQEIELISREMEDMSIKEEANRIVYERSLNNPGEKYDREWMIMEIDAKEAKGDALQKEIYNTTKNYAKAISELKEKIINLDAFIATTRNHY